MNFKLQQSSDCSLKFLDINKHDGFDIWGQAWVAIGKYWEVARPEWQGFAEFPLGWITFFHNGQHNGNIQPKNSSYCLRRVMKKCHQQWKKHCPCKKKYLNLLTYEMAVSNFPTMESNCLNGVIYGVMWLYMGFYGYILAYMITQMGWKKEKWWIASGDVRLSSVQ